MPGAGPEQGSWDFPPVGDFEASSEKALIAFLAKKQKAGADINAYRHLGTLLHHAIRAGQVATAQWLLAHGADPRKKVLQGGQDALGVAETYERSELIRLLQTKHGMALPRRPSAPSTVPSTTRAEPQAISRDQLYAMLPWLGRDVRDGKVAAIYKTPPETWRAFWRKQSKPIDYPPGFGWAAGIQPELWPELFASGYQDREAETVLSCLLNDISADEFKHFWPRLETHFTDIRQVAPRMILRAYRLAPGRYTCTANADEATAKLQFLTQLGIQAQVDAMLARELAGVSAELLEAMKPFTRMTFPKRAGTQSRLVQIKPGCKANLTTAMYRELATAAVVPQKGERYERVNIETVSPGRPPFLLSWQSSAAGLAFNTVESPELDNALYWKCTTQEREGTQCQGIPAMQPNPQVPERPPNPQDAYDGMDLERFLKTLRADHFERYQSAVVALDKSALKALQSEGIPASWTAQAIVRLGKSSLPLAEKRRRIAWLFVDRTQLRRSLGASYSVAESLIDWMPLRDWRPVLEILGEDLRGGFDRSSLRRTAEEKGFKDLACAIDNAQGFLCGETIDASRQ